MGEWIYKPPPPAPPHKHDYPETLWGLSEKPVQGSRWKCECGKAFEVVETPPDPNHLDDVVWIRWKEIPILTPRNREKGCFS